MDGGRYLEPGGRMAGGGRIPSEPGITATAHVSYGTVIYDDKDIRQELTEEFAVIIRLDDYR